jgi:endo-1,4-beta-xylanase
LVPKPNFEVFEMIDRRSLLTGLSAMGGLMAMRTGMGRAQGLGYSSPRLKDLMARCGGLIGTQAGRAVLQQDTPLTKFIQANLSILTPGNDLKWASLRPTPDTYHFEDADWVVNYCEVRGIAVHGHNLCWNTDNPWWVQSTVNSSSGERILRDHIRTIAGRYRGKIDSWDVVNEPVAVWHNRPDGLRQGPWLSAMGPAYIDIAFHAAAEADPKATRVLNLNHVEQTEKDVEKSREKTLELISGMLSRKVPVQAVGIESHLDTSQPLDPQPLSRFLTAIQRMGLPIMVTEIDVLDSSGPSDFGARDAMVAQYYTDYLNLVLPLISPKRLIFWSLSDYGNWYDHVPNLRRNDQQLHRPGLLDAQMNPKSALTAVTKSLQTYCR